MSACTINKICYYIENVIKNYKSSLKERTIDYEQFKVKRRCTQKHRDELFALMQVYIKALKTHESDTEENADKMISRYKLFGSDPKGLYLLDQEYAARVYSAPSLVLD